MKNNYLGKFDKFISLVWIGIWIGIWIQFSFYILILEAGLLSFAFILILYPLTTYLSKYLLEKAIRKKTIFVFIVQFILISVLSACIILLLYVIFNYFEAIGIFRKPLPFKEESSVLNDFIGSFVSVSLINFGFCGLRFFEENLKLQKNLIESQLQILQTQINPHTMFNVLNHVNVLIRKEPDLASSVLVQYTDILRYQLYSVKKEFVGIKEEVEFLKNFIDIEKVRWKNNLDVKCSWDIENDSVMLPPLLLITFVENAFKHVSRSKTEKGYVNIVLEQDGRELILHVENSKFEDSLKGKKGSSGIGLENIKRRLNILYPNRYILHVNESQTNYSTALTIKL